MSIVRARAPLRLGLAGGGTDISPYCDNFGGYVLNATIDRYAYAVVKTLEEPIARFVAADLNIESEHSTKFPIQLDENLTLHKTLYNYVMQNFYGGNLLPLELTTFCDAPAGSGLGSSSTLVIAMLKAFMELLNLPLDDYRAAQIAYEVERVYCGLKGGRQDQYSATFGGFNFMEFYADERVIINPLRIKNWIICELEASLVLYFTGVSRASSEIINEQSNNLHNGKVESLQAMHNLKEESLVMKESLLRGDFNKFTDAMRKSWESKKLSANSVSNEHIDNIFNAAIGAGALAGKVSGAGGGGFMWFFVPTEKRIEVINTLNRFGGQVSNCHFTKKGMQAWRV